jgi:hypothetical protein
VSAATLITGAQIKDGTVTTADIANNSLTGADVRDGGLFSSDIADGSLYGRDIAKGTVAPLNLTARARIAGALVLAETCPAGTSFANSVRLTAWPSGAVQTLSLCRILPS